jgi:hypothetical protein
MGNEQDTGHWKDIFNHREEQETQRNTEIKKQPNFFARAKKLESSFFALAKNEKLKALCSSVSL